MVVCRFFQQGGCRFGPKCNNEHFDIKQILKTDMEAALNGKMWPFSSYGPFKDKPCVPNFIDDQSFEEIRLLCYESKRQNCFEQFHQQFTKEVGEATNKMKALLQITPQILELVIKVYDGVPATEGHKPLPSNNPFSYSGTNSTAATNTSIFAKPTVSAGNIFGGAVGGTPFGTNAGNSSNIFGGGSVGAVNTNTNSIFGGAAASTNLFAQQPQQPQPQQQASIFSQVQTQSQPSIFGQQQQQQPNPFGQQPIQGFQNGNIFAQSQPVANVNPFAQQTLIGGSSFAMQQQPQQPTPGIFGTVAAAPTPIAGNMFTQAPQQQQQLPQQPPTGFFSQAVGMGAQQPIQMQQQQHNGSMYSRMEDLTAQEIEAFRAEMFTPGNLPFSPPPREFIN